MFRIIFLSGFFATALCLAESSLDSLTVTDVRAYETDKGRFHSLIIFDNDQFLGINPDDNVTPCQFWTKNEMILDMAITALVDGISVNLVYDARGDAGKSCQIVSLRLTGENS